MDYISNGQIDKADDVFKQTLNFSQKFGVEVIGALAEIFMGLIHIAKGRMRHGLNFIKKSQRSCLKNRNIFAYCISEYVLGKIYCEIAQSSGRMQIPIMIKNIGFIVKNVPFAGKTAEYHFNKAIETAKEIKANGFLGLTYLDLGLLQKAKKRNNQAKKCISEAVKIFEECEAEGYLKQAEEALQSLK